MGAALMQSGSSQEALEHLERSVAGLPDSAERRIELAAAYISARMPEKAVETLNAIPANSPVAPRARTLLVLATATGKSRGRSPPRDRCPGCEESERRRAACSGRQLLRRRQ